MYRETSPQLTFLEPSILSPGFLPSDDWCYIYRDKIWPLLDEDKFKHLYAEEGGAPIHSIKVKLSLLIFMSMETLTWRAAEFMFPRRTDWLHATCSAMGTQAMDHTTLFDFYKRLSEDDSAYKLFVTLTQEFVKECGLSIKKQRTDSFFTHGWLAILSRYGLFKETIRSFLKSLRKHQPALYESAQGTLSCDYLKDSFDLTEKDKAQTRSKVDTMAQELYRLKVAFENHESVKTYQTFQTLLRIFGQQCEVIEDIVVSKKTTLHEAIKESEESAEDDKVKVSEDSKKAGKNTGDSASTQEVEADSGQAPDASFKSVDKETVPSKSEVQIRAKPEGEQIISSPHNTDAVYTRKRNQKVVGHKSNVTETCDPDNPFQVITDVSLEAATHSDAAELSKIEERLEDNELKPQELYADAGYVNGSSILESEAKGILLEGPSAGRSQSIEGFAKDERLLDVSDFKVNLEVQESIPEIIACPVGHKPIDQKVSLQTKKYIFHFDQKTCEKCTLSSHCPVKGGKRVSTLTFNDAQLTGSNRHAKYMSDSSYRKQCAIRAGAESLVNEIANSHGARKSRHKTETRTRLQLVFAALSCNVKRYINHKAQCAQNLAVSTQVC